MKTLILIPLITVMSSFTIAGLPENEHTQSLQYFGQDHFLIEGTVINASEKESPYDRLPASCKNKVRKEVWELSRSSAGLSIRFRSNSSSIGVKWTLLHDAHMNHMADTGIKGVDLYYKNAGTWQYLNTGRPEGKVNEATLIDHMTREMREYKLYLPLYDGVAELMIGIDPASSIEKPARESGKSIIFYGTSITQGGCASRTGMAYTNIISRKTGMDCINLGFSGNGRMETPVAELLADTDAAFYVIDCLPNMNIEQVKTNTIPLVRIIREKQPETPIVFIENMMYEKSWLDHGMMDDLRLKNQALKELFTKMSAEGIRYLYYIGNDGALGIDHESTVDGVHFTDLGFMRYSDYLLSKFREFDLIR